MWIFVKIFKCSLCTVAFYIVVTNKQALWELLRIDTRSGFCEKSRFRQGQGQVLGKILGQSKGQKVKQHG